MEIVEDKFKHLQDNKEKYTDWINNKKWYTHEIYLDWLLNEIDEVKKEIRKNNSVYLEDELWDVLWDYLNLIYFLEHDWYIEHKRVFNRCVEKFSERLQWIKAWITRSEIKEKQKSKLKIRHNKKYNND